METLGQKSTLALHAFVTHSIVDFGVGEGVAQMKTTIHVRVGHTGHEFGMSCMDVIAVGVFFNRRSIDFKRFAVVPELSGSAFQVTEVITLGGLSY